MKILIIQARIGSSRLYGKVLKHINDKPMLKFIYDRMTMSKKLDKIIVATTNLSEDDKIQSLCEKNNILYFRGSENNVLKRYYDCAVENHAKTIIRVTADCPFADPKLVDKMLDEFDKKNLDYLANTVPPNKSTWPDGSDIEIFTIKALEKAYKEAKDPSDLEHVTFYFWKTAKHLFKTDQIKNSKNWSKYRFTVDYPEDYELVIKLNNKLKLSKKFGYIEEVIDILSKDKLLYDINKKYYFGIGWEK